MARGFWTGLGHGALLSAGLLAVISVLAPLPDDGEGVSDSARAVPQAQPAPPPDDRVAPVEPREAGSETATETPLAASVDLPVGSEFGRGGDVAPLLPTPLAAPSAQSSQRDAPAVGAPAAEPAPVAVTEDNQRPQTQEGPAVPRQIAPAISEGGPELSAPPTPDRPVQRDAPSMAASVQQDSIPSTEYVFGTAQPPAIETVEPIVEQPDRTPSLPSPGLDLSLPPDLTDLRSLGRD